MIAIPSLILYDNVKRGDAQIAVLGDGHTGLLRSWWHTTRAKGGYWSAGGSYHVSRDAMLEQFLEGMARRVVESVGGMTTWEGLVVEMDLTLDGVTYRRSLEDSANAVRAIYSKIGDNLFSDGSAESGAWAGMGTPSTIERVTTWRTKGTYGMHVVTDAADEGTEIENGIAIVAARAYQCRVTIEVVTGTWTLAIHRSDTNAIIASSTTADTGKDVLRCNVSDDNAYAGNTYVRITASATGAEIYADAAVYQLAPQRAETEWETDDDSADEWGRIEDVLLEAGMTDSAATAKVAKEVKERAWPRSVPPDRYRIGPTEEKDGLKIIFWGYVMTLNWRYLLAGGTDTTTAHVTSLVGESEFVTAGVVETNALSFQVEEDEPLLIWDALEEIVEAGDGSGNRWMGGVYADRLFNYEAAPTTVEYHYRGGQLLAAHGGPIEPWFMLPGLVRLDDAPVGPGEITGREADDPRNVFAEEIKYTAPDKVEFRRHV